ncbi:hypothetical protein EUTSA_v10009235mg [Eutrema salsugineum]|uniref:GAG1At protein n=1 Tax=Eutrema salsugineum TaxID=72664 RepID=V4KYU5_EUTSA|nr:uncharacterized protein LOC18993284 [Eutrema salsugineum]ESQ35207.1 hypothetical protein EUTSA_v10009235mg [Eutrema salsugineum]
MGNETKSNGAASMAGGGGFRAKMEHYVYSGDKKHVMAGIGIITLIFGIPWYLMNQGSTHQSHQDYMDKADKARKARLSSSNK